MKKLIILFLTLMLQVFVSAQENVAISVYQDPKLAFQIDDYGNTPFTLDMKIMFEMNGKQQSNHYFSIRPEFEYAELYGGKYVTWLVNGGWVFNKFDIEQLTIAGYLTGGFLHRWGSGYATYGITSDISYGKRLKISMLAQALKASDLIDRWGYQKTVRISIYVGLKYNLN